MVWFGRRGIAAALLVLGGLAPSLAAAEDAKLKAVATFSILADLVAQVGGDRVAVTSLVGPDADAHGYAPTPGDARKLAEANLIVVNGLGFEGWMERLIKASGSKAPLVVASKNVKTIAGSHDHDDHDHGDHDHGEGDHADPHAWQNVANVKLYVANIRDGLTAADPANAALYTANAAAYTQKLDALDAEIRAALAAIPQERRRIITTHDSFGYFSAAYGMRFLAPQGISTDSEAGPKDVARIIRQIRRDKVPAVFVESIADPRLMQQIARESGAKVGGRIYSDALSAPSGPAPGYLEMMRSNLTAFREALS
ncbi:periplasmic solute binding protein [Methylorubrum populi BJ001]|jgi:zinc/manganese transport system substrate-binding protein|uniref:Periplasmic solute binding protein n=1 Tax=Methylorubrum populi (strain ATCC BAA-705 / NCIMB 13946 / BJ001) TaxID=441620 RepID=B1ZFK0_METPB|nr:metal ABC transporter substrate-binding protein [Methylorubrum populi]ACB81153.1 periplasmic solute binding protein [Methylorubrum populi BJ001]OAH33768.1 metal ABC transporter substrate-binding protein [Methylorubrum populi]PZP73272.1 MAG: metal ABC transporter substrate-binding protein [Methylorubrum populi]